ncbi:MAG: hypothetical protein ABIS14_03225 [Sphingomonas sp.]
MRKERLNAIAAVTPLFRQAEESTDIAAADAAACLAEILRVRSANRLPIATATDMIRMLTEALTAQVRARELFIDAHRTTPEILGSLGLRAYGDENPCPPSEGLQPVPLKVVA